jgi:hypothetical protein
MNKEKRQEITTISKRFAKGFKTTFPSINGTGWLIVDPLSGYLNACGIKNELKELPAKENQPQVLIMVFEDGDQFIPAGADLKYFDQTAKNWMWV